MIRVFLLDDHEAVRHGLAELLGAAADIEVVGETGSAATAVPLILAARPDVMVLDRQLPDGDGIAVCRSVRRADPAIRGVVLTAYADEGEMRAAADAGASGCVQKQLRGIDLLDLVRQVAAGKTVGSVR